MKILFVSPVGALFSGAEVAIVNLMVHLAKNGHYVFNVIPDNETNTDHQYIQMMEDAGIQLYTLKTMKWWWYESTPINPAEKDAIIAYQHKNIAEVREIIRNEEIDLVISNTANVYQGALAAACEGCLHYFIIHEFPYGEFGYYREKIELMNSLSDKVFAVEGELYKELSNYFPENKLYSFVPYSQIENQELQPAKKHRIISIGGITERKNQLELIKVFHLLKNPDLELLFIGSWDEEYKLECDRFIEQHKLENITFLGYQKNPWQFVTGQDIIVFTSKLEAFPLVFVEAILYGVPTIISDNPGHLSVSKYFSTSEIYQLGDLSALKEKIDGFLKHYEAVKSEAVSKSIEARNVYTVEKASKSIVESIESNFHSTSQKIESIQSFFDLSLNSSVLEYIKNQKITIFYVDEQGNFCEESSLIFPLKESDEIIFETGNYSKIRIDLSENPSVFVNIKLVSEETGAELKPISTNGLFNDEAILFYKNDPQIIYDISHHQQNSLKFVYKFIHQNRLGEMLYSFIEQEKIQKNNLELVNGQLNQRVQVLQERVEALKSDFTELHHTYNSVIHSRRWTISTKIINFFRRNK